MPDIVLVQPPIEDFYLTAKRTVPYGLLCLAAHLEPAGFSVALVDGLASSRSRVITRPPEMASLEPFYSRPDSSPFALFHDYRHYGYSFAHIARQVKLAEPFLVGISALFTPYAATALATAAAIRKELPGVRIVVGGHHATVLPEAVLADPEIDFVIRGEGEAAMVELARLVRAGVSAADPGWERVPGLARRRPDGSFQVSPPAVLKNLADRPRPAGHLLARSYYRRRGRGAIVVMASRGCPLACSYCSVSRYGWQPYRRRPVAEVLEEIAGELDREEIGFIDFEDENLSLDRAWFNSLLAGLEKLRRGREFEVRAMNGLFPPSLDRELVAGMAAAGFKTLNLAVATFDREQLQRFCRPDVGPAHARVLEWGRELGLEAVSYLVAAAPGQSAAVSLADLVERARRPTLVGLSIFYPAPGSRDYERVRELGLLPERFSLLRSSALPLAHRTSRLEAATLLRLSRLINFCKGLEKEGEPLPAAEPFPGPETRLPRPDSRRPEVTAAWRRAAGRRLLGWFLDDGRIYGLTPEGEVYTHRAAATLTGKLQQQLSGLFPGSGTGIE
jgi:radical SAM superfamily enzyme YgiQ (UPF0313 family)